MTHGKMLIGALVLCAVLCTCFANSDEHKAQKLLTTVEAALDSGDYRSALDTITVLRDRYPQAVESRKQALDLWNVASLMQMRAEAAHTDTLLQATLAAIDTCGTLLEQNMLRNRRDSLMARLDAQKGTIQVIEEKQNGQ